MNTAPQPAMQLIGLRARFGATEVIRGADLVVAAGERHAIIGPNGAGKSTLFRLASGQLAQPTRLASQMAGQLNSQPAAG